MRRTGVIAAGGGTFAPECECDAPSFPAEGGVLADGAAAIAEAIAQNLQDRQRAADLGTAAGALVKKRYSWAHEMAKLESILLNGLNGT